MVAPAFATIGAATTGTTGTSVAIAVPSGVAVNDIILVHLYKENGDAVTPAAGQGFTQIGSAAAVTTGTDVQWHYIFWKRATAADSGTYTFSWSSSTYRLGVAERYTGCVTTGNPYDASVGTASRATDSATTPSVSLTTAGADRLLVWSATDFNTSSWTPPTSYTERLTTDATITVATRTQAVAGATGGVTGTASVSSTQTARLIALIPVSSSPTAPTVDAGADATHTVSTTFSRTATEADNGATITARAWTIVSGPAGAGSTIGTAAALSWTPTTSGTYVIRYSATNSVGTGTNDATITVQAASTTPTIKSFDIATGTDDVSCTTGATTAVGDLLLAFHQTAFRASSDLTAPTGGGWAQINTAIASGTGTIMIRAWYKFATVSGAQTVTTTVTGSSNTNALALYVISGVDDTAPINASDPAFGTANPQPVGPVTTTAPTRLVGAWGLYGGSGAYTAAPTGMSMVDPAGGTEKLSTSTNNALMAASQALLTTGSTGTRTPTVTGTPSSWASVLVAVQGPTAVAPTVNVGTDIFADQYDTVTRTATENNGGATITSRAWTVQSGPNQVGATIGTAAALSWAPTVGGDYVLRYTASNSAGSHFDELTVFVTPLNFPVTANLKLTGTRIGAKRVSGAVTAPIVLAATRTGAKRGNFSPAFNIKLAASIVGLRINTVLATIKLHAAAINTGRPGQGAVSATLKLSASATATRVTTGITRTANIRLHATQTGVNHRSGAVSDSIILAASLTGAKSVPGSVSANIVLAASIANVFHASNANAVANLILHGVASAAYHETTDVDVLANLILHGTPATSSVRFPINVDANIILRATAFGQRIITEVAGAVLPRADNTTQYELVCVARIPQTNGAPVFIEVDPIDWTQITHTDELSVIPSLSASAKISNMTEPVLQRLRNMAELPTELWLYRNGKQVFSGPLLGWTVNNESLTMEAQGLMSYLKMMYVTQDLVYKDVDQFEVVTGLINQWQNLDYGNFGIDTAEIPPSGVLRTVTYTYKELHNVAQRIDDLTKMVNGFDISIDPAKRKLELYFPFRGIDRSFGEDKIVFDARNVTSTNIACSAAPTDLASEGLGTGTGAGADEAFVSMASNAELRARYGRTGITSTFDQVTDQASLDSYVQAMIDARGTTLMIPGPNARVTIDADVGAYDVGDTVDYQLHSQLAVSGSFRIRKRTVTVAETGTESVSIEFV